MSRALLLIANLALLAAVLGAGWFAINAPQLARPALTPLGAVQLASEEPPTPRTPVVRTAGEARERLARRSLFLAPESALVLAQSDASALAGGAVDAADPASADDVDARAADAADAPSAQSIADAGDAPIEGSLPGAAQGAAQGSPQESPQETAPLEVAIGPIGPAMRDVRAESPIARTVIDALPAPSINPPRIDAAQRSPIDPLRLDLERRQPEVVQFFSWQSMDYEARRQHDRPPPSSPPSDAVAAAAPPGGAAAGASAASTRELGQDAETTDAGRAPTTALRPHRRADANAASAETSAGDAQSGALEGPALLSEAPRPLRREETTLEQTRRVEAAATTRVEQVEHAESGMILLGVFSGRGRARALVRTANGAMRVELGDEIDGWRVSAINEDSVQLRRASQTRLLKIPGSGG